jgi:hypothetical protein
MLKKKILRMLWTAPTAQGLSFVSQNSKGKAYFPLNYTITPEVAK